nr:SMI1/KNR4 family protein [Streptomyces sp. S1D4-11]QIY93353.1 hypothetical protein HEP87_03280 [Streptomyces sp. S1D4-11]
MSKSSELRSLCPPPADLPAVEVDWLGLEERIGTQLPGDYKWLVECYGAGSFDGFLHILQPSSPFEPLRLEESAVRATQILEQLSSNGETIPFEISNLLPVGKTDNGDTIYWVKRPSDSPDEWVITVNAARNVKWPVFDGGIVEFLVSVLSGERTIEVFPRSFPSSHIQFSGYPLRRRGRRR